MFEGFNELSTADQGTLIRLGQSQSRILVAALHWYDPEENSFRHFLSWRIMPPGQTDHFRQKLIDYSKRVSTLELDPIEAALLNVLVVIASGKLTPSCCYQGTRPSRQNFCGWEYRDKGVPPNWGRICGAGVPVLKNWELVGSRH